MTLLPRAFFGVLAAALLMVLFSASTSAQQPSTQQEVEDAARQIGRELQCPVCQGQSVADSQSTLATQMRVVIREKLTAGESRDQIVAYFVARYGEGILLAPNFSGFNAIAWIAPYLALLGAAAFLIWRVRRRPTEVTAEPEGELAAYYEAVDEDYRAVQDNALR